MTIQVGQIAPNFKLKDHYSRSIQLSDYLGRKNVFLAFFPLAWTPI